MISIEKYNHKMLNVWDDFVSNSNNGTMFNKQTFLNYHISRKFNNHSLLFYLKEKLVCVLPAVTARKNKRKILHSHPGASFGGLVLNKNIPFSVCFGILQALENYCRKKRFDSVVLINTPIIYYKNRDESLNYLLLWNNFKCLENYISHYIKIKECNNINQLLSKRKRRYIKNLLNQKKFIIKPDKNFNSFYNILLKSKKMFCSKPTHSLKELKKLQTLFPGDIELLVSKHNQEISGGSLLFYTNDVSCLIFYNVVKSEYRDSQLATLQIYACMERAKKQGYNRIDLGVSHTPENENPFQPKISLIEFKEQFGAKGVLRTVYTKDLND